MATGLVIVHSISTYIEDLPVPAKRGSELELESLGRRGGVYYIVELRVAYRSEAAAYIRFNRLFYCPTPPAPLHLSHFFYGFDGNICACYYRRCLFCMPPSPFAAPYLSYQYLIIVRIMIRICLYIGAGIDPRLCEVKILCLQPLGLRNQNS